MKIAVVNAGDDEFGIDVGRVVKILKSQNIHMLPQLPPFLAGVINIREEVIPVVDFRKRFGIRPSMKKERIIVVRVGSEKIGLLVDGVKEITNLQPGEISDPPSIFKGLKTEYMTGIGQRGERLIVLLNLDRLLTSREKIQLGEVISGPEGGEPEKGCQT